MLYKDKIQMSSQKCISIPQKTQPTLNSSFRQTNINTHKFHLLINTNCPQTSEFKIYQPYSPSRSREKTYIHNMHIDYGRLQRPNFNYTEVKKRVKYINEINSQELSKEQKMQTKRLIGISSLLRQNLMEEKRTLKKRQSGIKICLNLQKTEQKRISTLYGIQANCHSISKSKIRSQEIRAYDQSLKNKSSKKKRHSRIVKIVVAGGKKKTKIITYSGRKDYQRLYCRK